MKLWRNIVFYLPSRLFGGISCVRNWLFDKGIIAAQQFEVPVICIGNITVGGTGKTPHTEYLIRLFADRNVAVLSRGYKRKTSGFVLADTHSAPHDIGDEPYQIHRKFPGITVAVDEKRAHGIEQMLRLPTPPDIVLLDDAFQHRYVKPAFAIVLVDFNRPTDHDTYLPLGRLRESQRGLRRADCVIVTKCPNGYTPDETTWRKRLQLTDRQRLFFTKITYDTPQPLAEEHTTNFDRNANLLAVTGIATPQNLHRHLAQSANSLTTLVFADHHDFTPRDIEKMAEKFRHMTAPKAIVVTEKDRARLQTLPFLPDELRHNMFSIGIRVAFIADEDRFAAQFDRPTKKADI